MNSFQWVVLCPLHIEKLLAQELRAMGIQGAQPSAGKVQFAADLEAGYRVCLWSRLANRVLMPLQQAEVNAPDDLYEVAREVPWHEHLSPNGTFAIAFHGTNAFVKHPHFGALKIKDAIADGFVERYQRRPDVSRERPDLPVWAHLQGKQLTLYLDFAGESLHLRGYRREIGTATLKENLAAALLWQCDWPRLARQGWPLLDPLCGDGTILTEGLLMAGEVAPGTLRTYFGFQGWRGHQPSLWRRLLDAAQARQAEAQQRLPHVFGYDSSEEALHRAKVHLQQLGFAQQARLQQLEVIQLQPPAPQGLLLTDPPYGHRLQSDPDLPRLYRLLGQLREQRFPNWQVAILTSEESLAQDIGLYYDKRHPFKNGPLDCQLYRYLPKETTQTPTALEVTAENPFTNRLRKNLKKLKPWLKRDQVECFRAYDKDIPEYGVAVDRYGEWVQVQEYDPPKDVDVLAAETRWLEVLAGVTEVFGVPEDKLVTKRRSRQKGRQQYEKLASSRDRFVVQENNAKFWVNLRDYLDTGLFLDHRLTRKYVQNLAEGTRFLNLFCYTGSVTVAAALGGAERSVSVDLSKTYLGWARDNLRLNQLNEHRHQCVHANCLEWVKGQRQLFDLIFLDPPTFSNSKSMQETWDVQRDHVELLRHVSRLLTPAGTLIFSTNHRRFRLEEEALPHLHFEALDAELLPPDFQRNPRIHRVWKVHHAAS